MTLLIVLLVLMVVVSQIATKPKMTNAQIEKRIAEIYGGTVQNIVMDNDEAVIAFSREQAMYEVEMDDQNGSFSNLIVIFEPSNESVKSEPTPSQMKLLTPGEANTAATSKYFGTVQSNEFVEGEIPYYIVKITSATQRYTVHVEATSGNITSVRIEEL